MSCAVLVVFINDEKHDFIVQGLVKKMSNGMAFLDVPQIRPPTLCYSLHAFDPTVLILPLGKQLLLTTKSRMLPETV